MRREDSEDAKSITELELALPTLKAHLGNEWIGNAIRGRHPVWWDGPANQVPWARRRVLELAESLDGVASLPKSRVLINAVRSPRKNAAPAIQELGIAATALRAGLHVELEAHTKWGHNCDLLIKFPGDHDTLFVEATTLVGRTGLERMAERVFDAVFDSPSRWAANLNGGGQIHRLPSSDDELREIVSLACNLWDLVARTQVRQSASREGVMDIWGAPEGDETAAADFGALGFSRYFRGPAVPRIVLDRVTERIGKKVWEQLPTFAPTLLIIEAPVFFLGAEDQWLCNWFGRLMLQWPQISAIALMMGWPLRSRIQLPVKNRVAPNGIRVLNCDYPLLPETMMLIENPVRRYPHADELIARLFRL